METIQEWLGIFIVLAPIIIFVLTMLVIKNRLADQKVNLADLLAETEIEIKNQPSTLGTTGNQKAAEPVTPSSKRSASRFILFLSGVTSLILGVCITTFYFYMNIYCAVGLDLSGFINVLLVLGIGVVPYTVNQVKKIRL